MSGQVIIKTTRLLLFSGFKTLIWNKGRINENILRYRFRWQATKANAISELKSMWSCDRVVSFGDAINDIPMFQIADECYAVANAVESLKKIATGIIESNDNDGVAKWLKENYSKNLE